MGYMFFIFAAYTCVASFGIVNSIIGLIVTQTSEISAREQEESRQANLKAKMQEAHKIAEILWRHDEDGNGRLSYGGFEEAAEEPELLEHLTLMTLPGTFSVQDLHRILDKNGD